MRKSASSERAKATTRINWQLTRAIAVVKTRSRDGPAAFCRTAGRGASHRVLNDLVQRMRAGHVLRELPEHDAAEALRVVRDLLHRRHAGVIHRLAVHRRLVFAP